MPKLTSSDIVQLLGRFEVATDDVLPRHITHMAFYQPTEQSFVVRFTVHRHTFYIVMDSSIDDDAQYLTQLIHGIKPDISVTIHPNPTEAITSYAVPWKGREVYLLEVTSDKRRLDSQLAEQYPDTSRSTWQKHIKAGHVCVNGAVVTSPSAEFTPGDTLTIDLPTAKPTPDFTLPIIYEDDNVIVINKPVGILTHSKGALNDELTVADFFRPRTSFANDSNRPGIVHRLDRDTSGVMIGAKNPETATLLQRQFSERKTKKSYTAIVDGHLQQPRARIELPIARHPKNLSTFRVDPKGKSATTEYDVLRTSATLSEVELRPHTGRTHQLRVHMAHLAAPIHGDRVYGTEADRLYLHAHRLEITIPSGDRRVFEAPIPDEFATLMDVSS